MNLRLLFTIILINLFWIDGFTQSVGGWGTCEFATVALLNAFDPSTNSFDCKKAFVQATDEHYHWDGTNWVIDGSAVNLYTSDDTIVANRTVTMDGKSITFDGTEDVIIQDDGKVGIGTTTPTQKLDIAGVNKVQIGTLGGSGGGKLRVDISDGEAETQGIKAVVLRTAGTNYGINATTVGAGAVKNTALYGWASGATTNLGLWVDNGWGIFDDRVGIGTSTPDAQLDVENGTVRFSEYGTGTNTGTDTYVLSVDADGDVIEMNTAKSSKIFYPPALTIDASAIIASQILDLHQEYVDLYSLPAIVSSGAPAAIPSYAEDELYYYLTEFDTTVFDNVSIDANGIMTYDIISVPADECAFITMVFVVK